MTRSAPVRDARLDDLDAVRRIFRRASLANRHDREQLLAHPDVLELSDLAIREGRVRVATGPSDEVVGFVTIAWAGDTAEVEDLFVDPDWMGQGIGRQLVADVAAHARRLGAVRLEVTANPHAVGFYEKVGFVYDRPVSTEFGPAPRMYLDVGRPPR